jgi:hypothetical protein
VFEELWRTRVREGEWGGTGRLGVSSVAGVAGVSDKIGSKRFSGSGVAGVLETGELGRYTGSRETE